MSTVSPKPKRSRSSKLEGILNHAAITLNRLGVSNASLPAIAKSVGVSRAALYYYFEDQQDLVFQSYRHSCAKLAEHWDTATATGSDAMDVVLSFIDFALEEDAPEIAALTEVAFLRDNQRESIHAIFQSLKADIAGHLAAAAARGEMRECRASVIAPAILGMIMWMPIAKQWRSNEALSHADLVGAIKTILREGIGADRQTQTPFAPLELPFTRQQQVNLFDAEEVACAKQELLLGAASWLFNLKGIDATSLDEIADRLGITKKVIYHLIGDKEALVTECFRRSFRQYETIARAALEHDGSGIAAVMAANHAFACVSLLESKAPLSPLTGVEALPASVREEIDASTNFLMDSMLELHARGQTDGTIREIDARAVVAANPGGFEWLPKWFETLSHNERESAPNELIELYRVGLSPL